MRSSTRASKRFIGRDIVKPSVIVIVTGGVLAMIALFVLLTS